VLLPAAKGLLKACAAWYTRLSGSQQRCAIETLQFESQCLEANVNPRTVTPVEKRLCTVARSEILIRYATSLAQWQSPAIITLLAYIAWYFDSGFGLPDGILNPNLEANLHHDLFVFLNKFQMSQSIPMTMMDYLWNISELSDWTRLEEKQSFKRRIEEILLLVQNSIEDEWKLLESYTAAEYLPSCGCVLGYYSKVFMMTQCNNAPSK
jgi:hypothetical protein